MPRAESRDGLGVRSAVRQLSGLGAVVIAAVTLLALFAERWWVAELFTHFRVQYLAAGGVLAVAALLLHRRIVVLTMLATIVVNAIPVLGYLPFTATARGEPIGAAAAAAVGAVGNAVDSGAADSAAGSGASAAVLRQPVPPLRIITTNVRGERTNTAALIDVIRDARPDLFVVLELTPAYAGGLEALHREYPHRVGAPAEGAFGIGLYSRLPLVDAAVFPLGSTDAVRASVETASGRVDFVGVHLLPPMSAAWAADRNDQLLRIAALVRDRERRAVVCGDFNLTPYSPYFSRLISLTGLRDVRRRHGLAWTWPTGFMPLAVPIDHCLAGDDVTVEDAEVLGDIGSDHYPLLIDIIAGRKG